MSNVILLGGVRMVAEGVRTNNCAISFPNLLEILSRLKVECMTCLMKESVQTGTHIVRTVAVIFLYLYFGKKSHSQYNLE
jgi:hypothetical protein